MKKIILYLLIFLIMNQSQAININTSSSQKEIRLPLLVRQFYIAQYFFIEYEREFDADYLYFKLVQLYYFEYNKGNTDLNRSLKNIAIRGKAFKLENDFNVYADVLKEIKEENNKTENYFLELNEIKKDSERAALITKISNVAKEIYYKFIEADKRKIQIDQEMKEFVKLLKEE